MNEFDLINKHYGLSVHTGSRIKYQGKPATVLGVRGQYLRVEYDDHPNWHLLLHPIWKVEYLDNQNKISQDVD